MQMLFKRKRNIKFWFSSFLALFLVFQTNAEIEKVKPLAVLEDASGNLSLNSIVGNPAFVSAGDVSVVNLGVSESDFWIKITLPKSDAKVPLLLVKQPSLRIAELYLISDGELILVNSLGNAKPFGERVIENQNFLFEVNADQEKEYILRVNGYNQVLVPIYFGDERDVVELYSQSDYIFAVYLGVVVIMLLYNLFVYASVKDKTYIYYVVYLLAVLLSQLTISGYGFKYIWSNSSWFEIISAPVLSSFASIAALLFLMNFLNTKKNIPKHHKVLVVFTYIFGLAIVISFLGESNFGFQILQNATILSSLYVLVVAFILLRKKVQSAKFFLVAWVLLLLGAIFLVMRDFGILPSNLFTDNAIILGQVFEITLLSFALADKINAYKMQILLATKEKELLLKEQNTKLENQVAVRTKELEGALVDLKEAQSQLVQSEKMSSLGQLTAGIAHEINNPMNYARQSVVTIKRDVQDLKDLISKYDLVVDSNSDLSSAFKNVSEFKEEIDLEYLNEELDNAIDDVEDGIKRAVEIASELKTFSRIDQASLKESDIHEGLNSTLELMKSDLRQNNISIEKIYGNIPKIDCLASKLNQVFMNTLNNAIYAIKSSKNKNLGKIEIQTELINDSKEMKISFIDNGTGMKEETLRKIFDPFFTTKEVGEGSGLGMSISHGIIEEHGGKFVVESVLGKGTNIAIVLPIQSNFELND